jgi:hypothetical protein
MPSLIIFKLPTHPNASYEDWDVIDVLDAEQHPGAGIVTGPTRYGFVYITDAEPDVVRPILTESLLAAQDNSGDGGDVGDFDVIKRRKHIADGTKIGGPSHKWQTWRPYGDNQNIEVTWAQAQLFIEAKLS